jgi:DNA-directed RNA polymerase subunit H (RpoH/RPB5)
MSNLLEVNIDESQEIIKSLVVVKEMLYDRGVNIEHLEAYSENEIFELMGINTPTNGSVFQLKVNADTKIIYHMKSKVEIDSIKPFFSTVEADFNFKHVIFIFKADLNNNTEKKLRHLLDEDMTHEVFSFKRLLFNITKHSYVPKHEILSSEAAIQIQKLYAVKNKSQFPIILSTDPVARYYDIKPGQLVKIYRSSSAIGENITYRYCV